MQSVVSYRSKVGHFGKLFVGSTNESRGILRVPVLDIIGYLAGSMWLRRVLAVIVCIPLVERRSNRKRDSEG